MGKKFIFILLVPVALQGEMKVDSLKLHLPYVSEKEKISIYQQIYGHYYKDLNIDSASVYCNKALEMSRELRDTLAIAKSLYQIAILFNHKEELENGIKYFNEAIKNYSYVADTVNIAHSYLALSSYVL